MLRLDRKTLARLSRDRGILLRLSLVIVCASVGASLLLSLSFAGSQVGSWKGLEIADLIEEWKETIDPATPVTMEDRIEEIRFGAVIGSHRGVFDCSSIDFPREAPEELSGESEADPQPEEEPIEDEATGAALEALHLGIVEGKLAEGIAELEALPADLPYRNEFLGDLRFLSEQLPEASDAYLAEIEVRPDSVYAARSTIIAAWRDLDRPRLSELLRNPTLRQAFRADERLRIHADARDYPGMIRATVEFEIASFGLGSVIPSLGIAAVWFLILFSFWEPSRARLIASLVAFALGIFSATLTLFAVILQERIQGFDFSPGDTPMNQFLYFLVGVGLREETIKLLCCLPVLLWANRRKSDIEGMLLAAMVGLGFAFKENILYLESGPSSYIGWVRFLTANALHFSLTGVAGFYLYRMMRRRGRGWEEFLASFLLVVLAHGIYNSILAMPSLASYAALSPILIAIIAYRFFDPLRSTMDAVGIRNRVSPLGIFVIGSVLMTCLVLLTSSTALPFRLALGAFLATVAGMIPLSFAFISRFRDL